MAKIDFSQINLDKLIGLNRKENNVVEKIEPKRTALIIIDMQKFFCYPDQPCYVPGGGYCPSGQDVIAPIKKIIEKCREKRIRVIWSWWSLRPDGSDEGLWIKKFPTWKGKCLTGNPGLEIVDELKPRKDEIVFEKKRYSNFYDTPLEIWLKGMEVNTLILVGVTAGFCVRYTLADAFNRDYKTIVLTDCTAGINSPISPKTPGDTQYIAALRDFQIGLGDIMTSKEFFRILEHAH